MLVAGIVEVRPRKKAPRPDPNLPNGQRPQHGGGHGRSFVAGRLRLQVIPNRKQETLEPFDSPTCNREPRCEPTDGPACVGQWAIAGFGQAVDEAKGAGRRGD